MKDMKGRSRNVRLVVVIGIAVLLAAAAITGAVTAKYVREVRIPGMILYEAGLADQVSVLEHEPQRGVDGVYSLNGEKEVSESEFILMPGVDAPRDPFVKIEAKTSIPAYVYVEVVSSLDQKAAFELTEDWEKLEDVAGKYGGAVYAYKEAVDNTFGEEGGDGDGETAAPNVARDIALKLLRDDTVTVSHTYLASETEAELSFYPYMAKAEEGKTAAECFDRDMLGLGDTGKYTSAPQGEVSVEDGKAVVGDIGYSVYVRGAVVIYWKDDSGNILAKNAVYGTDYTFDTDSGWFRAEDGYYYYSTPVESGGETGSLVSVFSAASAPPEGYSLTVDISAEVIQSTGWTDDGSVPAVTAVWGCTVNDDNTIGK